MKLYFCRTDLNKIAHALKAGRCGGSRVHLMTQDVLVKTTKGSQKVLITGLDSANTIQTKHEVATSIPHEDGAVLIPIEQFTAIIAKTTGGLEIDVADNRIEIASDLPTEKFKASIPTGNNPKDFPDFQILTDDTAVIVDGNDALTRKMARIEFALPAKDVRRILLGINLKWLDGGLLITGTDGKKLARDYAPNLDFEERGEAAGPIDCTAPPDLLAVLDYFKGRKYSIKITKRQLVVFDDHTVFYLNAIEGRYPDCDSVIPKESVFQFLGNRSALQQSVRRAMIFSDEKDSILVKVSDDGSMTIRSASATSGKGEETLRVQCLKCNEPEGITLEFAVNGHYFMELMGVLDSPEVTFHIKSATSPILVTPDKQPVSKKDLTLLLMPVKLAEPPKVAKEEEGDE